MQEDEARRLHAQLARSLARHGYVGVLAAAQEPSGVDDESEVEDDSEEARPQGPGARALLDLVDAFEMTLTAARELPAATFRNLAAFSVSKIQFADPVTREITHGIDEGTAVWGDTANNLLELVGRLREMVSSDE